MSEKRKNIRFVRWGGLSAVRQKHYETNPEEKSFHNPPEKHGIYAFPEYAIEMFLVASMIHPHRGRSKWLKDENGNKVEVTDDDTFFDKESWLSGFCGNVLKIAKRKGIRRKKLSSTQLKKKVGKPALADLEREDDDDYVPKVYATVEFKPKKFEYTGNIWHHLEVPNNIALKRNGSWVLTTYHDYLEAYYKERSNEKYTQRIKGYRHSKDHYEVFIPDQNKH
jgi:hypothetical protein